MARVTNKKNDNNLSNGITIVKHMRDYSKEPFFLKKLEEADRFFKKHGLPKSVTKR